MTINYVTGDATLPQGDGRKLIAHICNDVGAWGAGFVVPLGHRYPLAEQWYRNAMTGPRKQLDLGKVQVVPINDELWIANMVAQHGIGYNTNGNPPICYDALAMCLDDIGRFAKGLITSVHMPRIGCGLAGGDWNTVEKLINDRLVSRGIAVTVYDLPQPTTRRTHG